MGRPGMDVAGRFIFEILDEAEQNQLREELRKAFAWDGKKFTLEQLRKIKAIIIE